MPHNRYASHVFQVHRVLRRKYRDPRHYNKSNPLHELVFILLSVQTSEQSYRDVYRRFRQAFPTADTLPTSSVRNIASAIHGAGLSTQRARAIRGIYRELAATYGRPTLAPLRSMSDKEAEEFLVTLPRVGTKVARCVLMYSLGRKVFPIDTHVWRIAQRIGWVRAATSDQSCRKPDMDRLQNMIPPRLRYSLHVNLVALGRKVCLTSRPKCDECPIEEYCRKVGVKSRGLRGSVNGRRKHSTSR